MLWTIVVALISFWLLGLVNGSTMGDFIHIALVIAIIVMLFQFEEECSHRGPRRARVRPSKRRVARSFGKILPGLSIPPAEKVRQPISPLQAYREGQPL